MTKEKVRSFFSKHVTKQKVRWFLLKQLFFAVITLFYLEHKYHVVSAPEEVQGTVVSFNLFLTENEIMVVGVDTDNDGKEDFSAFVTKRIGNIIMRKSCAMNKFSPIEVTIVRHYLSSVHFWQKIIPFYFVRIGDSKEFEQNQSLSILQTARCSQSTAVSFYL